MTIDCFLLARVLLKAGVRQEVLIIRHACYNLLNRTTVRVEEANLLGLEAQLAFEECTVGSIHREFTGALLDVFHEARYCLASRDRTNLACSGGVNLLDAVPCLVQCANL